MKKSCEKWHQRWRSQCANRWMMPEDGVMNAQSV
jgi:hypothetical protein